MFLKKNLMTMAPIAITPEAILPNGVDGKLITNPYTNQQIEARKGSIAASIYNVVALNKLLAEEILDSAKLKEFNNIVETMKDLIPVLVGIGVFNLFPVEEWLRTDDQPGRVFVGILCLEQNPSLLNEIVKKELKRVKKSTKITIIAKKIEKLIAE